MALSLLLCGNTETYNIINSQPPHPTILIHRWTNVSKPYLLILFLSFLAYKIIYIMPMALVRTISFPNFIVLWLFLQCILVHTVLTMSFCSLCHTCSPSAGCFSDIGQDCWTHDSAPRRGGGPSSRGGHSPPPHTLPHRSPPLPQPETSPRR